MLPSVDSSGKSRDSQTPTGMLVVFMCGLAAALSYCDRTNISIAAVSMAKELGWTSGQKGRVLGSFFWGYLFSQLAGATLSHKYGGKLVLGLAAVCWSVSTLLVPILARQSIGALVFGRFLLGLAEGVTFPAIYYLLRQFVNENARSRAVAAISIGTISGAVTSFLLSPILVERFGWDSVFLVFGGIFGPAFVLIWFFFVPSTVPTPLTAASVVESAKLVDGEDDLEAVPVDDVPPNEKAQVAYITMLQNPVLASIFLAHFAHNLCHFALMSWLPTFLNEKLNISGDSLAISSLPWIVMGLSISLSSTVADRLICSGYDKPYVRRVCTVTAFVVAGMSMSVVALLTSSPNPHPFATLVFLSIALGANGASTAGGYEAAKLDLTMTASAASRLQSLSNTLATLAGVFGVPLVAMLKGNDQNWENVFIGLSCAFFFAASVFHSFGRWTGPIL